MRLLPMLLLTSSLALFSVPAAWGQQVLREWDGKGAPQPVSITLPGLDQGTQARLRGLNRYALVFGNADYAASPLPKSTQDAASMAALLRSLGFTVYGGVNLTKEEMERQMQAFTDKVKSVKGATVLWYFSGHGVQIEGKNYLLPVDVPTGGDELTIKHHGYSLDYALDRLNAIDGQRLIFLDACRNNNYVKGFKSPYVPSLAKPSNAGPNTLVSFATGADTVARTGADGYPHSLYTERLLAAFQAVPRSSMTDILDKAAVLVRGDTDDRQIPEVSITLGGRPFYPIPPICEPAVAEAAWGEAERLGTVAGYRAFASRCSDSAYVSLAMGKASFLERQQTFQIEVALLQHQQTLQKQEALLEQQQILLEQAETALLSPAVNPPVQTAMLPPPAASVMGVVVPSGVEMVSGRWGDAGSVFRDRSVGLEMVMIPSGSFQMGSPDTDKERYDWEGPFHEVKIPRSFAVGKYEVTFSQWDACVSDGGCNGYRPDDEGWGRGDRPVINVSWADAQSYIGWLNSKVTGVRFASGGGSQGPYRLLTEAEFEYVARGVTSISASYRKYWWGESYSGDYANGHGELGKDKYKYTSPVGTFPLNPFGVSDILGNVREWTEDCWIGDYKSPSPGASARQVSGTCSARVLRGGSWSNYPRLLRAAVRSNYAPGYSDRSIGFRVARTITF